MSEQIKGGEKRLFLKAHAAEILDYWNELGDQATMTKFTMGTITLDKFLTRNGVTNQKRNKVNRKAFTRLNLEVETTTRAKDNATAKLEKLQDTSLSSLVQRLAHTETTNEWLEQQIRQLRQQFDNATGSNADQTRLIAEIAAQGTRDLRRDVHNLESEYEKFTETVADQLRDKFLLPLLRVAIQLPEGFEKSQENILSVTGKVVKQLPADRQHDGPGMQSESKLKSVLPE